MSKEKILTVDLPTLSLSQAEKLIELSIKLNKSVFLHGPVGVGKSDLIKSIGKKQNRKVIDIRLSQMDSTDLRGIPFCPPGTEAMKWAPPIMFPTDPEDDSILFFDELNCAPPSIQATAYQLILDRKIGEYILPKKCSVIAAGNREGDRGIVFKMPSPLLNRFSHIEVSYDFNCWFKWAYEAKIHSLLLKYLMQNKSDFISDTSTSPRAFATPRTWSKVSLTLYELIGEGDKIGTSKEELDLLRNAIAMDIGQGLAIKMVNWFERNLSYPDIEKVLSGEEKLLPKHSRGNTQVLRGFSEELALALHEEHKLIEKSKSLLDWNPFYQRLDNAFAFIIENSQNKKEVVMMFINLAADHFKLPLNAPHLPTFKAWIEVPANNKYIVESIKLVNK